MSWVAVAIGGSAALGAGVSMAAADKQSNSANQANQQIGQQFGQTQQALQPWVNAGGTALTSLQNLSGMAGNTPLVNPAVDLVSQIPKPTRADAEAAMQQWHMAKYGTGLNKYSNMATWNKSIDDKLNELMVGYNQKVAAAEAQQKAQQQAQAQAQAQQQAQQAQQVQQQAPVEAPNLNTSSGQLQAATQNAPLLAPFTLADFKESPAYKFNLEQGLDTIRKASAARGNYYAPATLEDMSKYSQGLASNEFNNAYQMYGQNQSNVWNRLFGLSGTGQNAATQVGAFGSNAANNQSQNTIGAGNAQAAGLVGASNAITGGAGDLYNQWLARQILTQSNYGGGGQAYPDSYFDSGSQGRGH